MCFGTKMPAFYKEKMDKKDLRFSQSLIKWYDLNKRDLPWRLTKDPYRIWLSEVILQQTRVNQGMDYYLRFVDTFPSVEALADAEEDQVLKLWQGLGYYSRARNLHNAAKEIQYKYKGVFPKEHKDVINLKGVGEYTAAAIVSIAYNMPYATVDGNVYRVLSRVFGISEPIDSTLGKKVFAQLAQDLIDERNPGQHNQAVMELGALQCVPVSPDCSICPLTDMCVAYSEQTVATLPVKQGKVKTRKRYFNYLDVRYRDSLYLSKRGGGDIWEGLYELPLIEVSESIDLASLLNTDEFRQLFADAEIVTMSQQKKEVKHILSHQQIYANFYKIELDAKLKSAKSQLQLISLGELSNYAVSRLVDRYFETELAQE